MSNRGFQFITWDRFKSVVFKWSRGTSEGTWRNFRGSAKKSHGLCQIEKKISLRDKHFTLSVEYINSAALSSQAKYIDRAAAACRQRYCQLLRVEGVAWWAQRFPTAVYLSLRIVQKQLWGDKVEEKLHLGGHLFLNNTRSKTHIYIYTYIDRDVGG
jgi:hypothetical protein